MCVEVDVDVRRQAGQGRGMDYHRDSVLSSPLLSRLYPHLSLPLAPLTYTLISDLSPPPSPSPSTSNLPIDQPAPLPTPVFRLNPRQGD